jgi:AcrR family transcriptional regulator
VRPDVAGGHSQQRQSAEAPSGYAEDRERLIAAVAKAAAEHGYAKLTVEQVVHYAGVSEDVFLAHFENKEQAMVAAQDSFLDRLWLDVIHACEALHEWPLKVRAGLGAVLTSLAEASSLARVFAVEAAASPAATERQFAALDQFATLLRDGRRHYPRAASLPDATERALVGGIASILSRHLLMEDPQAIPPMEGQLVELLLIPYLGEGEARRVAAG